MSVSRDDATPYVVVARGPWSRVTMVEVASSRRVVGEVERAIEEAWREGLARTGKLFDGPTCRMEGFEVDGDEVTVRYSRGGYKWFYGTNMRNPGFRQRYGRAVMADPIGLSTALVTGDGYLVFGRRNQSVAYYPGRVHPFSGALEPGENPFDAARRELSEEVGLRAGDLGELRMLGVVEDRGLGQPEFVFESATTKTLGELHGLLDDEEHEAIVAMPVSQLAYDASLFTPVAMASLRLFSEARGDHGG